MALGIRGHAALSGLDTTFPLTIAALARADPLVGSHVMQTRLSSAQLKRFIGVLPWVIAAKMAPDLIT